MIEFKPVSKGLLSWAWGNAESLPNQNAEMPKMNGPQSFLAPHWHAPKPVSVYDLLDLVSRHHTPPKPCSITTQPHSTTSSESVSSDYSESYSRFFFSLWLLAAAPCPHQKYNGHHYHDEEYYVCCSFLWSMPDSGDCHGHQSLLCELSRVSQYCMPQQLSLLCPPQCAGLAGCLWLK